MTAQRWQRGSVEVAEWGREEVVVFDPAPVFSVELSGGAGETWCWHLKHLSLPDAALHCLASLGSWWAGAGKGGLFCLCSGLVAGVEIVWVYSSAWIAAAVIT